MRINRTIAAARRNAVALLALFVALGGTGYAASAINGQQLQNRTVSGSKLKRDTLGGAEVKESRLLAVPSAKRADSATNADTLGGIDSAAFTRGACSIRNGAIHGYARILAGADFSATFTTAGVESPYNCSGQSVEARRTGAGLYEVRFNGAATGVVVATNMQLPSNSPSDTNVSLSRTRDGTYVATVADLAGNASDWPFVIVLL
jgi:hypothetical protein